MLKSTFRQIDHEGNEVHAVPVYKYLNVVFSWFGELDCEVPEVDDKISISWTTANFRGVQLGNFSPRWSGYRRADDEALSGDNS